MQSSKEIITDSYVGPRPYRRVKEDQIRFFGRDYEADQIVSLIFAHKLVLVYARSGAGKTSVFNGKVIPTLEDSGFEVLPLARIGTSGSKVDLDAADTKSLSSVNLNHYIFNTLQSLKDDVPLGLLLDKSLSEFLNEYFPPARLGSANEQERKKDKFKPQVLIFDQLEEIFNLYPDKWIKQQEEFFRQVNEALDNNFLLRIVFVMREDYIAQLVPFLNILPERLRPSYRLEALGYDAALDAIKRPLENMGLDSKKIEGLEVEVKELSTRSSEISN